MLRTRTIRLLMLGGVVAVIAGVVQITGAAATSSTGAPAIEPFGNYVPPTGAELSPAQVEALARKYAADANEAAPTEMSMARGSFAAAQAAMEPGSVVPSNATIAPWESSSAYLVVMHGQFTLRVPVPPGRPSPAGPVMALILDAHTGFPEGRYVGVSTPNIASLGAVTPLGSK